MIVKALIMEEDVVRYRTCNPLVPQTNVLVTWPPPIFFLEWRHGRGGHLVLPSEDYRTEPNSRWRRLMTIADYKVTDNSTLALIPRQNEYDGSQVRTYSSMDA